MLQGAQYNLHIGPTQFPAIGNTRKNILISAASVQLLLMDSPAAYSSKSGLAKHHSG